VRISLFFEEIECLRLSDADEVIMTPFSFIASSTAFFVGATDKC